MVLNLGSVERSRAVNITMLIDRSGSMETIRDDVIGGINQFLDDQKNAPGVARLTMIMFDSHGSDGLAYQVLYSGRDIRKIERLGRGDFVPRGATPLYDALGRAINDIDGSGTADVQLLAVFTDGKENASKTFTKPQVFEMITARRARGWVVTLMMANEDAYAEGASMGFSAGSTQSYAGDGYGTRAAYDSFSANTTLLRGAAAGGQSVNTDFFAPAGKGAETDLLDRKPDDAAAQGIEADKSASAE